MSAQQILEIGDAEWEKTVEKAKKPVVVMFSSPTCPHCHTLDPYFQEYAKEFRDQMVFIKFNVVDNQFTASRYGVMGTPTFKFFCAGRPVQELVGVVNPPLLKKTVEDVLKYGTMCIQNSTAIDYSISGYA